MGWRRNSIQAQADLPHNTCRMSGSHLAILVVPTQAAAFPERLAITSYCAM